MIFDVTLKGFEGDSDRTDHLVKWVSAPNREVLNEWLLDSKVAT